MKSNPSPSAPLVPLAPPAGITGTTLPDSPVKDTPAEVCKCRKCGSVHEWSARVKSHATFCPNCWDMMYDMIARPAPASPVDSVGVPELVLHAPLPWQREEDTIHDADGGLVAILSAEDCDFETLLANGDHIVTACNSHAAKDAKIKELSLRMELLIMRMESEMSRFPKEEKRNRKGFMDRGRAALALPCA